MNYPPVTPIIHNQTISAGAISTVIHTPAPKSFSVLARVLSQQCEPTPAPIEEPLYTSDYLARLNASRVGKAFHVVTAKGELLRRGYVCEESNSHYIVAFITPYTGLPGKKQSIRKSAAANWKWFDGVEESNTEYRKNFTITHLKETTPTPRLIWTDRSLEQIYFSQEKN